MHYPTLKSLNIQSR